MEVGNEIGVIISDALGPTHLKFNFQLRDDVEVKVGEFVEVPIGTKIILGRIVKVHSVNEMFKDPEFIRDHIDRKIPLFARYPVNMSRWRAATTQIIGVIEEDRINPPEYAPEPGDLVYRASTELLKSLLNLDESGIYLGKMYGNFNLKVTLNTEKVMKHHIAVIGATGSGKSYTVGVIIEELLEKGYPVVVIDPHGEYYGFEEPNDKELGNWDVEPKGYETIKYSVFKDGKDYKKLRISTSWLNADSFAEMLGVTEVQYDLLFLTFQEMRKTGEKVSVENLSNHVERIGMDWGFSKRTIFALKRKIHLIRELGIIGKAPPMDELVSPGRLTIIDLSEDIEDRIRVSLVGILLDVLFRARKKNKVPKFLVVVEEAHRFAPQDGESYSKSMMRKIVREGRKFGIGLCITSQRVVGLDKDVISQCGTKIILRIDSKTDLEYISPYLSYSIMSDLQIVPFLPNGVAIVNSISLRAPVMVNVRVRKSRHIGI
ncbi:MAG: ATP-binding protein [Candidatus Asgardarchaeia archaeon]